MATWAELLTAAHAGELCLDPAVAQGLVEVCDRHIERLRDVLELARNVETVTGFGLFPSGVILAAKFTAKGVGQTGSIQEVIRGHIDTVMAMRAVIEQAARAFEDVDAASAARLARLDPS